MSDITDRIEAWQAAGLIDADTATRLRAAEATVAPATAVAPAAPPPAAEDRSRRSIADRAGISFGPGPTIAEMFAYLGAAFVIAAYSTFLARVGSNSPDRDAIMTAGSAIGTVALVLIGVWLSHRDERSRRGAGVLFVVAVVGAAVTADFLTQVFGWSWAAGPELFIAVAAVVVAILLRVALPAIATQAGLLGALTALGAATLDVIRRAIEGRLGGDPSGGLSLEAYVPPRATVPKDIVLPTAGWLLVALLLGVIALWEARRGTPGFAGRAGVTRLWAGLVAVVGTWSSVSAHGYLGNDIYGRILAPYLGDAFLIVVVAVLVERAIRRDAAAFIVPAALGLIAALTDLNVAYFADSAEVGLLIEGAILLAVGFAADRIRRRLGRGAPRLVAPDDAPA